MTDTSLMTASTDSSAASDGVTDATAEAAAEGTQDQQTADDKGEGEADKTADTSTEGDGSKTEDQEEDATLEGAPETYEDFTAPEGVEFDAELIEDLKTTAKELNLPQARAQQLADLGAKMAAKWATAQAESVAQLRQDWVAEVKADKDIGGENLGASLAAAKKVVETFGTPALRELLNGPVGDNPEVIRFFVNVSKAISEDTLVAASGEPAGKPKDFASQMYTSSKTAS